MTLLHREILHLFASLNPGHLRKSVVDFSVGKSSQENKKSHISGTESLKRRKNAHTPTLPLFPPFAPVQIQWTPEARRVGFEQEATRRARDVFPSVLLSREFLFSCEDFLEDDLITTEYTEYTEGWDSEPCTSKKKFLSVYSVYSVVTLWLRFIRTGVSVFSPLVTALPRCVHLWIPSFLNDSTAFSWFMRSCPVGAPDPHRGSGRRWRPRVPARL